MEVSISATNRQDLAILTLITTGALASDSGPTMSTTASSYTCSAMADKSKPEVGSQTMITVS